MIRGLIVGHKTIGTGFLAALESISGSQPDIEFLSNTGLSTKELADRIREMCSGAECSMILFVDVYGGSCWRAAKMAQVPGSSIVTGLNLPMLLSFVNKRLTVPFEELPGVLAHDGCRGITAE